MNVQMLDIIFIIFLFLMAFFGYIRGFITRLYDFIGALIVLFLSYILMKPVASLWTVYPYETTDVITTLIGKMMNQLLIFVILFIVLTIIKKLLGLVIKPILKGFMDTFAITSFADKVLGVILSLAEALLISYLCIVFVMIPFYDRDMQKIKNTLLVKYVVEVVPDTANKMSQTVSGLEIASLDDVDTLTKLMLTAHDLNLIDDEQFSTVFQENIMNQLATHHVSLSSDQKDDLEDILETYGYTKEQLKDILSKINVSEE